MQDTYTLQPAMLRDAPAIAGLSATHIEYGLRHSWTAQRVAAHIRHRECVVLTAKSGTELAGFAVMQFADTAAHLNLLAVVPHARRRGLAARLLTWLHETALTAGTFTVSLELRSANQGARRFYEALGYRQTGTIRGYYDGVEDAVRMRRDLAVCNGD